MKTYELLPPDPGLKGRITADLPGAVGRPTRSYELLPGGLTLAPASPVAQQKGCSCRDNPAKTCACGATRGPLRPVDLGSLVASAQPSRGSDARGARLDPGILRGMLRDGGGRPEPATSLCDAYAFRIRWLRGEIERRTNSLGPRGEEIAQLWRQARRACSLSMSDDLCWQLVQLQANIPDVNRNVDAYNAATSAANACRSNLTRAEFERLRLILCLALTLAATRAERQAAEEMRATPEVDYLRDIAPLEDELAELESRYRRCFMLSMDPSVHPSIPCARGCRGWYQWGYDSCRDCCNRNCGGNQEHWQECCSSAGCGGKHGNC